MAPRKDKLKQTVQEDKKRLLLRVRKWPYANILTGTTAAVLGLVGFSVAGGNVVGLVTGLIAAAVGGALQKPFQGIERTISLKLYDMAGRIEIVEQTEAKDKSAAIPNSLLDEFPLYYHGGHPSWRAEKVEFGSLQVYERSVVFKNLRNRLRMPMARLNKVTLETFVQVRVRKIPEVVVPEIKASKNKAIAKIQEFIRRKQRFVVLDYTDDSGSQRLIVFWPTAGNPRFAKQVKEVLDGAIRKAAKDRQARAEAAGAADFSEGTGTLPGGSGPLVPTPRRPTIAGRLPTSTMSGMRGGLHEVSQDALEAAKRASQAALGDQGLTLTTIMRDAAQAKPCPYCKFSMKDPVVVCSLCSIEHHEGCWKANFGCTTSDCRGKAVKKGDPAVASAAAPAQGAPPGTTAAAPTPAGIAAPVAAGQSGNALFQVVLASAGSTEQEREAVASQMASLFNIPVDKVRIVLQRVPAIAKRNLNRPEAESLAERFRNIGADAQVEEMKG